MKRGELSVTPKQGIITNLPKGNKPRELLKNWRPISLLNVPYKVLSNVLANRLKDVLPCIIHENQKGFMAGRYIGENTRVIYDVLHVTKERKNLVYYYSLTLKKHLTQFLGVSCIKFKNVSNSEQNL